MMAPEEEGDYEEEESERLLVDGGGASSSSRRFFSSSSSRERRDEPRENDDEDEEAEYESDDCNDDDDYGDDGRRRNAEEDEGGRCDDPRRRSNGEKKIAIVRDPRQEGDGSNAPVTYRVVVPRPKPRRGDDDGIDDDGKDGVSVETNKKKFPFPPSDVRRRYSDFRWLHDRFHSERPGSIVPILPHHRALSAKTRRSSEAVALRRRDAEEFLNGSMTNPELVDAPSLKAFLTAEIGPEFDGAKREAERSAAGGGADGGDGRGGGVDFDPLNGGGPDEDGYGGEEGVGGSSGVGFSETASLTSSVGSDGGGSGGGSASASGPGGRVRNLFAKAKVKASVLRGNSEFEKTDDDDAVDEARKYIDETDKRVKDLIRGASKLIRSSADAADAHRDLGRTVFEWNASTVRRSEPSSSTSSDATAAARTKLAHVHQAASETAGMARRKSELEESYEQRLRRLARTVRAADVAHRRWRDLRLTYTTRTAQAASRKTALGRARGSAACERARRDLDLAERSAKSAKETLESCGKRLLRETDRIKVEIDEGLASAVRDYAAVQVVYLKRMQESWSKLLPRLEDDEDRRRRVAADEEGYGVARGKSEGEGGKDANDESERRDSRDEEDDPEGAFVEETTSPPSIEEEDLLQLHDVSTGSDRAASEDGGDDFSL